MDGGEERMDDGIKILMPPRRHVDERYAAIDPLRMLLTAIYGYAITPRREPGGQLLRESLKAPIPGRDPPRADNCNTVEPSDFRLPTPDSRRYPLAAFAFASTRARAFPLGAGRLIGW